MLPRIKYFISFSILLLIANLGFSQSGDSYQFIKDPSGLGPSANEIIELKKAADSIIAKIPLAKRDSFKVIEGAIYPLLSNTVEGVNESISILKAKATLKSKYHLLIARSYNKDGEVKVIWDLLLPKGEPYDCINDVKKQLFFGEMNSLVKKSSFTYSNVIKAINSLTEKFDIFLYEGFRGGECAYCPSNVESLQEVFLDQGYVGRKIKSVQINSEETQEGNFSYNKKVKIFLQDEDTINIFSDMQSYYNDLTSVMDDIYFNFTYYNTSNPGNDCLAMNDQIEEGLAFTSDDEIAVRTSGSQYIYKCDVVVIDGEEGNRWVFVKESSNLVGLPPSLDKGTIHIVLLNVPGLNIDSLVSKVKYFYNLISVNAEIKKYEYGGLPNRLGIPILKNEDAISLVGVKGLSLVTHVRNNYSEMLSTDFINTDIASDEFVSDPKNLERGDGWGKQIISIIKTETMTSNVLIRWKCTNNKLKLTAFLIFHATGHNAGIQHYLGSSTTVVNQRIANNYNDYPPGYGYMMDGSCILTCFGTGLGCNDLSINALKIHGTNKKYNSLEDLILNESAIESPYIFHQIFRIRSRFKW